MPGWLTNLSPVHILRQLITTLRIVSTACISARHWFCHSTSQWTRLPLWYVEPCRWRVQRWLVAEVFFLGGNGVGELRYDIPKQRKKYTGGFVFFSLCRRNATSLWSSGNAHNIFGLVTGATVRDTKYFPNNSAATFLPPQVTQQNLSLYIICTYKCAANLHISPQAGFPKMVKLTNILSLLVTWYVVHLYKHCPSTTQSFHFFALGFHSLPFHAVRTGLESYECDQLLAPAPLPPSNTRYLLPGRVGIKTAILKKKSLPWFEIDPWRPLFPHVSQTAISFHVCIL